MVCLDISDRKRTHDALHASEEKLRAMFDFSPLGIALSPLRGCFVEVNPALEQMCGYRSDELAKLDFYDLVSNKHRRDMDRLYEMVQERGRYGPLEVELQSRGGGRLPVALNGVMVTGGDGNRYIWSTVEDITERVRATETLQHLNETLEERVDQRTQEVESQRHFIETVLDTAGALVMLLDRDGRIVRFNKACEELSGYSFAELRGNPFWSKLFPTSRVDSTRSEFDRLIQTGETTRYESEWLTRAGETRLIAWSNAVLLGHSGRVQHVIATGIDVSDRKRAERALKQANTSLQETVTSLTEAQDKLVQAEKMASLGGLVAGISHEINTPLGIGVTSATNIREEVAQLQAAFNSNSMKRSTLEGFVKHVDQASEILLQNLRRASELITSFKQVAVDQTSDDWRWLNLHEYVDEIILSLKPKWKQTRIRLVNECDPQLSLYTAPGVLYQVLSNFIVNSLLHAFEDEQAGHIRIRGQQVAGHLELIYSDDGKGIAEEIQGQIFDPFFTTQRGSGGSGLGLHIVYNLVSGTLGGSIDMSSTPGQGVQFRMEIPLSSEEQRA
jgi:PAS domain S-box-containing protein